MSRRFSGGYESVDDLEISLDKISLYESGGDKDRSRDAESRDAEYRDTFLSGVIFTFVSWVKDAFLSGVILLPWILMVSAFAIDNFYEFTYLETTIHYGIRCLMYNQNLQSCKINCDSTDNSTFFDRNINRAYYNQPESPSDLLELTCNTFFVMPTTLAFCILIACTSFFLFYCFVFSFIARRHTKLKNFMNASRWSCFIVNILVLVSFFLLQGTFTDDRWLQSLYSGNDRKLPFTTPDQSIAFIFGTPEKSISSKLMISALAFSVLSTITFVSWPFWKKLWKLVHCGKSVKYASLTARNRRH
jgi:hypothetical protein